MILVKKMSNESKSNQIVIKYQNLIFTYSHIFINRLFIIILNLMNFSGNTSTCMNFEVTFPSDLLS